MDQASLDKILTGYDIDDKAEIALAKKFISEDDLNGLINSKILKENTTRRMWAEIQNKKDILYVREPVVEGPHKIITGLIMGACGNGMTSLINNVCGTVHATG